MRAPRTHVMWGRRDRIPANEINYALDLGNYWQAWLHVLVMSLDRRVELEHRSRWPIAMADVASQADLEDWLTARAVPYATSELGNVVKQLRWILHDAPEVIVDQVGP